MEQDVTGPGLVLVGKSHRRLWGTYMKLCKGIHSVVGGGYQGGLYGGGDV